MALKTNAVIITQQRLNVSVNLRARILCQRGAVKLKIKHRTHISGGSFSTLLRLHLRLLLSFLRCGLLRGLLFSGGGSGFGYGGLHKLGQGQASGPAVRVPAPVAGLDGVAVREVAAGHDHTLLLGACGGVWSCGKGLFGKLGHGDEADLATPRRIGGLEQVRAVQVAAGPEHSLVLSAAGHVYSFGWGGVGQLGHGDEADQPRPVRVAALLETRVCQLSAGADHSLATDEAGAVYAWGRGVGGRLGLGLGGPERIFIVTPDLFRGPVLLLDGRSRWRTGC